MTTLPSMAVQHLFDGALEELTATYTAPAVVLGALDHALYVSNKAELKDFEISWLL